MKLTNRLLAIILLAVCAILSACEAPKTPEEAARRQRALALGDKLLAFGERKGIVTAEDAAFVREVGTLAVTTKTDSDPTTSTK